MRLMQSRAIAATAVVFSLVLCRTEAQTNFKYQEPPKAIVELVDTRPTPAVEVSTRDKAGKQWILIEKISGLPSIADLAQRELRLAGLDGKSTRLNSSHL